MWQVILSSILKGLPSMDGCEPAASAGSGSGATVPAPTGSPVAPPSVPASAVTSGSFSSFGGRAEKYLPPDPFVFDSRRLLHAGHSSHAHRRIIIVAFHHPCKYSALVD